MCSLEKLEKVAAWLRQSRGASAFTGAGISTESGIPDFRSPGGVWSRQQPVYFDEFLASDEARKRYWQQKSESHPSFDEARPNAGHTILAQWEGDGRLRGVITQNIDGLHQMAGSQNVLELHGTARLVGCLECDFRTDAGPLVDAFLETERVPECPRCRGLLKHATISFGQMLPHDVLQAATRMSMESDLFLTMGSSLVVSPAADLPIVAQQNGARLVIINRDETALDAHADVVIRGSIGTTLTKLDELI